MSDIKAAPEGKVSLELRVREAKVLQEALKRVKAGEVEFLGCVLLYTDKKAATGSGSRKWSARQLGCSGCLRTTLSV